MRGTYTRWTRSPEGDMRADLVATRVQVEVLDETVWLRFENATVSLDPDAARMIGVRLIEGAVHADPRAIREVTA